MVTEIAAVTIDCTDPQRLAGFWAQVLGVAVSGDYGQYVFLESGGEGKPTLAFQRVPDPTPGKNRVHVDLRADDRPAEVARLTGLGATYLSEQEMGGVRLDRAGRPGGQRILRGGGLAAGYCPPFRPSRPTRTQGAP